MTLIVLSPFHLFEFPTQQFLRSSMLSKRVAKEPATGSIGALALLSKARKPAITHKENPISKMR